VPIEGTEGAVQDGETSAKNRDTVRKKRKITSRVISLQKKKLRGTIIMKSREGRKANGRRREGKRIIAVGGKARVSGRGNEDRIKSRLMTRIQLVATFLGMGML